MRALLSRFMMTLLVALTVGLPPLFGLLFPRLSWVYVGVLLLVIVAAAGLRDYLQNVKPHVDFQRKRRHVFDLACENPMEGLREYDETARLNILEIRYLLPRKKWGRFRPIYQRYMEGARDIHLGMRVDQGVSGEAVRTKRPCLGDLEDPNATSLLLEPDQQDKTEDLTVVFSYPIRRLKKLKEDDQFYPTDEIIGVLNIDSSKKGAYSFYNETVIPGTDITLRKEVEKVQEKIALICSRMMS